MKRACIAIVDAARARLYTYDQSVADPTQQLLEVKDLTNPGRRLKPSEMFSETRPSLAPSGQAGPDNYGGPAKDDHRNDHIANMDMKFAKEVIAEVDRLLQGGYGHLIVVASHKMLGELRAANGVLKQRPGLSIEEIANDLTKLTNSQLHDHLADLDLIPPRQRLVTVRAR